MGAEKMSDYLDPESGVSDRDLVLFMLELVDNPTANRVHRPRRLPHGSAFQPPCSKASCHWEEPLPGLTPWPAPRAPTFA